MSHLVDDMLILSKMEAGTLRPAHDELDLRDTVRRAWADSGLDSAAGCVDVSLDLPPYPVVVRGDPAYLARAVSNLLSNALKCVGGQGIVSCALIANERVATLRIVDSGFGIPTQEQSSLFTRFFRTSTAREREMQGAGLGLAITAAIVDDCGGSVSVVSEHLGGAAFTMDLPLATTT